MTGPRQRKNVKKVSTQFFKAANDIARKANSLNYLYLVVVLGNTLISLETYIYLEKSLITYYL